MAKQSRLAGFLGLERYQDAERTPEESPQAVQADSRKEASASAGQAATAQKTDSSHRLSALPGTVQRCRVACRVSGRNLPPAGRTRLY